jgi:hypothetical protein
MAQEQPGGRREGAWGVTDQHAVFFRRSTAQPRCCVRSQMMRVEVTKYNKRYGIVKMAAKGYVGADLVVEAELTLAMGNA